MNITKAGPKIFKIFGERCGISFGTADLYLLRELEKEAERSPGGPTFSEKLEEILLEAGKTEGILEEKARGKKIKAILRKRYKCLKTW